MTSTQGTPASAPPTNVAVRPSFFQRVRTPSDRTSWKVEDLMSRDVMVCQRTDSCMDVAERMREGNVGILPVLDRGAVVGVVTDRDLALRHVGRARVGAGHTTVEGCMTRRTVTVSPEAEVAEALQVMRDHQVRRLLVMEGSSLHGILTLDDIFVEGHHSEEIDRVIQEALAGPVKAGGA